MLINLQLTMHVWELMNYINSAKKMNYSVEARIYHCKECSAGEFVLIFELANLCRKRDMGLCYGITESFHVTRTLLI